VHPARRRLSPTALIAAGVLLALAGALGLIVAADHAPTLSNAFTKKWVLKPGAYDALRLLSFGAIGLGLLSAVAGVVRHERTQPPTEPHPPAPPTSTAPRYAPPRPPTPPPATTQAQSPQMLASVVSSDPRRTIPARRSRRSIAIALGVVTLIGAAAAVAIAASQDDSPRPSAHQPVPARDSASTVSRATETESAPAAVDDVAPCHGESSCGGVDTDPVDGQCGPGQSTPCASDPELAAAIDTVATKGYTPIDLRFFDTAEPIQAILATSTGSADSGVKRVFFFAGGEYLGTDTSRPSGEISFGFRDSDTIALRYGLWRPEDPQCCATGGAATVRFQWDGRRVRPLDPIPSASLDAPLSRR
jgi:hypothetical protein